jgi:hypothetical protein
MCPLCKLGFVLSQQIFSRIAQQYERKAEDFSSLCVVSLIQKTISASSSQPFMSKTLTKTLDSD